MLRNRRIPTTFAMMLLFPWLALLSLGADNVSLSVPDASPSALIEMLDHDNPAVREKATAELLRRGDSVEKELRGAAASPSAEVRARAKRVLDATVIRCEAASDNLTVVFEGLAQGQRFTAIGKSIDEIMVRTAYSEGHAPTAEMVVEVRDQWLDQIYLAGRIEGRKAANRFKWIPAQISFREELEVGKSYVLLLFSTRTPSRSAWLIDLTSRSIYAGGERVGSDGDLFFSVHFKEKRRIHVGPAPEVTGALLSGEIKAAPVPLPLTLGAWSVPDGDLAKPGDSVKRSKDALECERAEGVPVSLSVVPDGSIVAGATADGKLTAWDTGNGRFRARRHLGRANGLVPLLSDLQSARSGDVLAVVQSGRLRWDHRVWWWDARQNIELKPTIDLPQDVYRLSIANKLVAYAVDQTISLREHTGNEAIARFALDEHERVNHLILSRDGNFLAAAIHVDDATGAAVVRVWDVRKRTIALSLLAGRLSGIVALSADGLRVVAADSSGYLEAWDVPTRTRLWKTQAPYGLSAIALSRDGSVLATGGLSPSIKLWDARTGRAIGRLERRNSRIIALIFAPNGDRLCSTSADGTVVIWQIRS